MQGESPRVFTLEAANALLPEVRSLVAEQMERRAHIEQRLKKLGELVGGVPERIQVDEADPPAVRALKGELVEHVQRYEAGWGEVEAMGVVVKDPRAGLVDFYGQVDGKHVWLCWKYGEDAITHYHGLHEGFSGRKAIEPAMRDRHLN